MFVIILLCTAYDVDNDITYSTYSLYKRVIEGQRAVRLVVDNENWLSEGSDFRFAILNKVEMKYLNLYKFEMENYIL